MDGRVRDRVAEWSERPVEGLDGLRELADRAFSGVVEAPGGEPWFAMLNGAVLGVHGGRVADFEGAAATARAAPEPGVALLIAMLAADGEREDRYYTEDTPISQAHETLGSGGFSGYLELSENVLSGDYYVAYYGDRSMPVAFVGNSERLVTGDEALERADDEVGIYQVYSADLDVVELPTDDASTPAADADPGRTEPEAGTPASDADRDGAEADAGGRSSAPDHSVADRSETGRSGTAPPTGAPEDARSETGRSEAGTGAEEPAAGDRRPPDDDRPEREYGSSTSYGTRMGSRQSGLGTDPSEEGHGDLDDAGRSDPEPATRDAAPAGPDREGGDVSEPAAPAGDPADGPEETRTAAEPADSLGPREAAPDSTPVEPEPGPEPEPEPEPVPDPDPESATGTAAPEPDGEAASERATAEIEDRLDEHQRRVAALADRVDALEGTSARAEENRRSLRATVEEVAEDLSDLRRTVMRLDRTVERLQSERSRPADSGGTGTAPTPEASGGPDPTPDDGDGTDLAPEEALAETTLLLRYGSRGEPTLEAAHEDDVDRAAVEANLRVDVHTPFDDRTTSVDGTPYRAFIEDRIEYRFFEWLVRDLLFEIRETGTQAALADLYDALPSIDRAELRSTVVVDGREGEAEPAFDVVVRDAHERPLVVARINASRDPATEEMVVGLRDSADVVGADADLAAAFSVTESYFSGTARDAAEEATADSILSRNSKESYVKVSRRNGYHLCLVAVGSDEEFHLRVPDL